jgi:hypothetical protein
MPEGKRPLGTTGIRDDNIKMDLKKTWWEALGWTDLDQDRNRWRALVNMVMNLQIP